MDQDQLSTGYQNLSPAWPRPEGELHLHRGTKLCICVCGTWTGFHSPSINSMTGWGTNPGSPKWLLLCCRAVRGRMQWEPYSLNSVTVCIWPMVRFHFHRLYGLKTGDLLWSTLKSGVQTANLIILVLRQIRPFECRHYPYVCLVTSRCMGRVLTLRNW